MIMLALRHQTRHARKQQALCTNATRIAAPGVVSRKNDAACSEADLQLKINSSPLSQ